jgi:3-deoxy-7-phosphoheptulonate synthase
MLDVTAVVSVHELSHLPIVVDPSHGTGIRTKVPPMARAAVAAGADGVIVEVHPDPDRSVSDAAQAMHPDVFAELVPELRGIAQAIDRDLVAPLN